MVYASNRNPYAPIVTLSPGEMIFNLNPNWLPVDYRGDPKPARADFIWILGAGHKPVGKRWGSLVHLDKTLAFPLSLLKHNSRRNMAHPARPED